MRGLRTSIQKETTREAFFSVECRSAYKFSCLTCYKVFDRESVKAHISCVTEEEKYQKGDANYKTKKTNTQNNGVNANKAKKDMKPEDYEWKGIRKTCRLVLADCENMKMEIKKFAEFLANIYANKNETSVEDVNADMLKRSILDKLEDNSKFVIDLSKGTIRYKMV
jgi:hypothetical protein